MKYTICVRTGCPDCERAVQYYTGRFRDVEVLDESALAGLDMERRFTLHEQMIDSIPGKYPFVFANDVLLDQEREAKRYDSQTHSDEGERQEQCREAGQLHH